MTTQIPGLLTQDKLQLVIARITVAVTGSIILMAGLMFALLVVLTSLILTPIAALRLWMLDRQIWRTVQGRKNKSGFDRDDSVIEGNYSVIEN